jgi:PHD/YefM family antitoxin component YafN of YafNO toxin-antitoxin module
MSSDASLFLRLSAEEALLCFRSPEEVEQILARDRERIARLTPEQVDWLASLP